MLEQFFIILIFKILNARTLLGLLSQSSGAISNPVSADILSTSNTYFSIMGVFSSGVLTEVVLVESSDVTLVDGVCTWSSATSVSEEQAISDYIMRIKYIFFICSYISAEKINFTRFNLELSIW